MDADALLKLHAQVEQDRANRARHAALLAGRKDLQMGAQCARSTCRGTERELKRLRGIRGVFTSGRKEKLEACARKLADTQAQYETAQANLDRAEAERKDLEAILGKTPDRHQQLHQAWADYLAEILPQNASFRWAFARHQKELDAQTQVCGKLAHLIYLAQSIRTDIRQTRVALDDAQLWSFCTSRYFKEQRIASIERAESVVAPMQGQLSRFRKELAAFRIQMSSPSIRMDLPHNRIFDRIDELTGCATLSSWGAVNDTSDQIATASFDVAAAQDALQVLHKEYLQKLHDFHQSYFRCLKDAAIKDTQGTLTRSAKGQPKIKIQQRRSLAAYYCPYCGASLELPGLLCPKCGEELPWHFEIVTIKEE